MKLLAHEQPQTIHARTNLGRILQRRCACGQHTTGEAECEACRQQREGTLQRAAAGYAPVNVAPPLVQDVLNSSGQPLDESTRTFMEPRFSLDFSQVRVHTDERAVESARSVNALAYTVGRNIVFGAGQYAPGTAAGKSLLAHELTHVVQQDNTPVNGQMEAKLEIGAPGTASEREAERNALLVEGKDSFVGDEGRPGQAAPPARVLLRSQQALQRQPDAGVADPTQAPTAPTSSSTTSSQPLPGSPYASLPADLVTTINRSFNERVQKAANSEHNLDNGFCWGNCQPATVWDALNNYGVADINTLVEIYQRAGGAWQYIDTIQNVWTGSSRGFLFTCKKQAGLIAYIKRSSNLCKDSDVGQSEHQKPSPKDCWREVVAGGLGLHFCLDRGGSVTGNELHIDLHQTVNERDEDGSCTYNKNPFGALGRHWLDVFTGYDKSVFEVFQDDVNRANDLRQKYNITSNKDLGALEARLVALKPYMQQQAVRGQEGEQQAEKEKKAEVQEIGSKLTEIFLDNVSPEEEPSFPMP
ncbi:MAG: hypothetical protein NVS4B9_16590 [Ktedonobacteraceae bacterium]